MNQYEKEIQQTFLDNEKKVLNELKRNYKEAIEQIDSKIAELLGRQDADQSQVVYQVEFQKALKKQNEAILLQLQSNNFETVSQYLSECYEDGFVSTLYSLQKQDIPLILPMNQEQIVQAIKTESKLSTTLYDAFDIKDLQKTVANEISRGISTAMTFSDIARNIENKANIEQNKAIRIARTEGHRIQTTASMHACEKAKSKGADIVKQWESVLDSRTRESHQFVDGEYREIEEKFSNGLMFPSDPNGSAGEVINCRCALLQRSRKLVEGSFTKGDSFSGQLLEFDSLKDYQDFKKRYFSKENMEYMKFIESLEGKYATNNFETLLERMTDKEYSKFHGLEVSNPLIKNIKSDVRIRGSKTITKEAKKIQIDNSIVFNEADKKDYSRLYKQHSKNVSKEDAEQIRRHEKADGSSNGGYVATTNYQTINSNMRKDGFTGNQLDEDDLKTIDALRKAINSNVLDNDYYLMRYVNADYLSSMFGVKYNPYGKGEETLDNAVVRAENLKKHIPKITEDMQSWVGKAITEDAFVSTSLLNDKNIMKDKPVLILIEAPKGTNCYVPKNQKESECILSDKTQLFIKSIEFDPTGNKWIINARYLGIER